MRSDERPQGDDWVYCETSDRTLTGAIASGMVVSGIAALIVGNGILEKTPFILLFVFMGVLLVWFAKKSTTVVISRKGAVIRKDERSIICRKSRTYPLSDFTAIAIKESVRSGEEGYPMAEYSLVLQGPGQSLTILSTDDREEAGRIQKGLRAYLAGDPGSGSSPSWPDTPW